MSYTNPRMPHHRSTVKVRLTRVQGAMGYYAVGDVQSGLNTTAGALAQLTAAGSPIGGTKAGGFISKYVNPVVGGGATVLNFVKTAAPAAPTGAVQFMRSAPNATLVTKKGSMFGIPTTYLLLGGAGVAALVLLKKKKR